MLRRLVAWDLLAVVWADNDLGLVSTVARGACVVEIRIASSIAYWGLGRSGVASDSPPPSSFLLDGRLFKSAMPFSFDRRKDLRSSSLACSASCLMGWKSFLRGLFLTPPPPPPLLLLLSIGRRFGSNSMEVSSISIVARVQSDGQASRLTPSNGAVDDLARKSNYGGKIYW